MQSKENIAEIGRVQVLRLQVAAYGELLKFRLSLLVALSAVFGYAMAAGTAATALQLIVIGVAGLLITGASNALNQLIEREYDAQMLRTANRPLPTGRLTVPATLVFALVLAVAGVAMLGLAFNLPAALLGIIGLLSYAFVYTPLKRITPFAVFVGAIPGGLPPLIGWVAFTGSLDQGGLLLFAFQFFWQFPHFWAIAWQLDEDYRRAGFFMLPSPTGRTLLSARMILLYTLCMIPLAWFPYQASLIGGWGALMLALLGLLFVWPAWKLFRSLDAKYARQLMFYSFLYLPAIQLTFLLG
ncbi:MAG: heme o synthase [Bacteroidia bacterium]